MMNNNSSYCVDFYLIFLGIRGFPSAIGSDRHLYAWKDPHTENLPDPDIQSPFVAEDTRECGHGSVSGTFNSV